MNRKLAPLSNLSPDKIRSSQNGNRTLDVNQRMHTEPLHGANKNMK